MRKTPLYILTRSDPYYFENKRKYTPYPSAEPIHKRRKTSTIEKKANFLNEFVVQHDEYMQDDTEYHPESEDVVEEVRTPMNVIVEAKNKQKAKSRKNEKSVRRSENQSRIFCNHCKTFFYAKPTLRKKKHVFALNHACKPGEKRRQYVLGRIGIDGKKKQFVSLVRNIANVNLIMKVHVWSLRQNGKSKLRKKKIKTDSLTRQKNSLIDGPM